MRYLRVISTRMLSQEGRPDVIIVAGGAITFLFFALAAANNLFPSRANLFRSSKLIFCVPSLALPRWICFLTDARLLKEPSTDDIEPPEYCGRIRSDLLPFFGVPVSLALTRLLSSVVRDSGDL